VPPDHKSLWRTFLKNSSGSVVASAESTDLTVLSCAVSTNTGQLFRFLVRRIAAEEFRVADKRLPIA
jgi:hypothetical protein